MASAGSLEENNFKIPSVFGSNAVYKTAPNNFPTNSPIGSVKASWKDGFPEQTFQPNNAPSGADINGLFGLVSALLMNTQMGQMINTYDATYQGKIGGYPNGAIIWFVPNSESPNPDWSNRMLFQSTADGNKEVPYNTTTSTVGAGWKQLLPVNINPYASFPDYSKAQWIITSNYNNENWNYSLPNTYGWVFAATTVCEWSRSYVVINDTYFEIGGQNYDEGTGTGAYFIPVPSNSVINKVRSIGRIAFYPCIGQ